MSLNPRGQAFHRSRERGWPKIDNRGRSLAKAAQHLQLAAHPLLEEGVSFCFASLCDRATLVSQYDSACLAIPLNLQEKN